MKYYIRNNSSKTDLVVKGCVAQMISGWACMHFEEGFKVYDCGKFMMVVNKVKTGYSFRAYDA